MPTPSTPAQFAARQSLLVDTLGTQVTFYSPPASGEVAWPSGAVLDPNTGAPYDPTIEPSSGGEMGSASAMVGHYFGREDDEGEGGPIGIMPDTDGILIVEPDDYTAFASAAVECDVRGERYKISRKRARGLPGAWQWIFYVEAA